MVLTQTHKILLALTGLFLFAGFAKAGTDTNVPPSPGDTGSGPADVDYRAQGGLPWKRNNNPGNLKDFGIKWQGAVVPGPDKPWAHFIRMKWGIRAMLKDLQNDYRVDGMRTLRKLITVYAPSSENNTALYVSQVSGWTGINADAIFADTYANWKKIAIAMARKETGKADAITGPMFEQVWSEFNF